ncbi:MAG: DJ-1/PfpI family protein [Firmicutes bacterium]|nr:DJ-1/PfpI family protein [Bacillota bacterium]
MISILLGSGFEEVEAITVFDILKRAGADIALVSVTGSIEVSSARNLVIKTDELLDDIKDRKHQMIVIPGGMGGVKRIINSPSAKIFLQQAFRDKTKIGAICAGPIVLDKFGLFNEETKYTCYPGVENEISMGIYLEEDIVIDNQFITSVGPGTAEKFAFKLVEIIFDKEKVAEVKTGWFGK